MKIITKYISLILLITFIDLIGQPAFNKNIIVDEFCSSWWSGINKAELESGETFFQKFTVQNSTYGDIFGNGLEDAAIIFEEQESGNGYRVGVIFKNIGNNKLKPEAFTFNTVSALESGAAGGSYFTIDKYGQLVLTKMRGSSSGEIYTYYYNYNITNLRFELVAEDFQEYDRHSENELPVIQIDYAFWERQHLDMCEEELGISGVQMNSLNEADFGYQACLDEGKNMANCAQDYYNLMDKLLNKEYQLLRAKLNEDEKNQLKTHQLVWLKNRDDAFSQIEWEVQQSLGGQDARMMIWNQKADYIRGKIIQLMEGSERIK